MSDFSDSETQERLQSYLKVHLKKDDLSLSPAEKIDALKKKKRNRWIQLAVNMAAILFFGYSFYFDITKLSNIFFYIIIVVFALNVGLIFYQKGQIKELIEYMHWKQQNEG